MTLQNDRDAEMAMGSTWATTATDQHATRRGEYDPNATAGGGSTDTQDTGNGSHPVDTSHDVANGGSGTPTQGGGSSTDSPPTDAHNGGGILDNPGSVLPDLHDTLPSLVLAGDNGELQPALDVANSAIQDIHTALETVSDQTGLSGAVHGVTNLGETIGLGQIGTVQNADGHTNLLTDVLNAPGDLLNGDLSGVVSHLGADLSDVLNATTGLVGSVLGSNDASNPLGNIISDLGHDLQTLPLLNINGGNNAGDGGLLGGALGNLNSSSGGHLIDLDAGPQSSNGLVLDLLSQPEAGPHHAVEVNAVDVSPGSPQLLDLGVLTGSDGLNIPNLGGTGTDGLTGNLLGNPGGGLLNGGLLNGPIASGNTANVPVTGPINIDAVHDLLNAPLLTDHGVLDTHGSHIIC